MKVSSRLKAAKSDAEQRLKPNAAQSRFLLSSRVCWMEANERIGASQINTEK